MANDALWRIGDWFPDFSPFVLDALRGYHRELLKFNPRINLISRGTEREADEAHVADALLAARALALDAMTGPIHDFGAGNGIPGMIFAILQPNVTIHLVESDSRKIEFIKHVIHTLKIPNAFTVCARVASLPPGSVTTAVNRGFASLSNTLRAANTLIPAGGVVFHLKGSGLSEEMAEVTAGQAAEWSNAVSGEYRLPVSGAPRVIVKSVRR